MFINVKKIERTTEAIKIDHSNVTTLGSMGFLNVAREKKPDGNTYFNLTSDENQKFQLNYGSDMAYYAIKNDQSWKILTEDEFKANYTIEVDKPKFTRSRSSQPKTVIELGGTVG